MSYSSDSTAFKLNFTDGTFMTILNYGADAPTFTTGQHEFIIPNFYLGEFSTGGFTFTKYDYDGNEYVFSQTGVIINGTIDTRTSNRRQFLQYDPVSKKIKVTWVSPDGSGMPIMNDYYNSVEGICYDSFVGTSPYSSFGQALYAGENKYYKEEIMHAPTYYQLENVVKRAENAPYCSTTVYYGHNAPLVRTLSGMLYVTGVSTAQEYSLDLSKSVTDFDPENPLIPDTDPLKPGGITEPSDVNGDFDDTSDPIDFPPLPTLGAIDTGFITLYNPSLTQLQDLSDYMWSSAFDVDSFKKVFANPMDVFLGLSIVPVSIPDGSIREIKVGGISTGKYMTPAAQQYIEVPCGSINVKEYWGAYLDYEPFTKAEIYLPYIGTHPLAVDDIMGKTVEVRYHVDILSGSCTAFVKCGDSVLYQFIGQCSSSIPISGNDWTNVINAAIQIAGSIGTMVATGGASIPASSAIATASSVTSSVVSNMKPSIEKSGAISGTGGLMGAQTPYLILTRPRQALPASQNYFTGYPSFITELLGALSGYTEVERIHLSGIPGTDAEIAEIETLLKEGVIL